MSDETARGERPGRLPSSSAFDAMVDAIQAEIIEQERAIFSEAAIAEFNNPYHIHRMEDATASATVTGSCNDTMEFYLKVEAAADRIEVEAVSFMTDGCGASIAAGSMLARLVDGRSLDEAEAITPAQVLDALDGLPTENVHCAALAVQTLRQAIRNYRRGSQPAEEQETGDGP